MLQVKKKKKTARTKATQQRLGSWKEYVSCATKKRKEKTSNNISNPDIIKE